MKINLRLAGAVLLWVVALNTALWAEDRVKTLAGTTYNGRIASIDDGLVTIDASDGARVVLSMEQIQSIEFGVDSAGNPDAKPHYDYAGLTLLTPARINIVLGHWYGDFGFRLSFGYWGETAGVELDGHYSLGCSDAFNHGLFVGLGIFEWEQHFLEPNSRWRYLAAGWQMNLFGIFLQIGLSAGEGSFQSPQYIGQIGYVYEFR